MDIVRPIRSGCVQYEILEDNLVEGDEQFTPQISTVSGGATIGNPSSTTITIEDSCEYSVCVLCVCMCNWKDE